MEISGGLALFIKALTNTLVRLMPIGLYTGSAMSSFVFSDFRATILFIGFMINEFISLGYRLILRGKSNPQCAVVRTDNGHFSLPSPIPQTVGFFVAFYLMKMYEGGEFEPLQFFTIVSLLVIVIWSRVNVGCGSTLDMVFSASVGLLLGSGYFWIVRDYYKHDYLKTKDTENENLTYDDVFFKL